MAAAAMVEPSYGMDKLSYEIFSILESKFLFGYDDPNHNLAATCSPPPASSSAAGRVRVLSVDAGGSTEGLLAAASLARLEASLRHVSGDASARIPDFFDVAAGSGVGGLLVALLFTRGHQGRPLLSASEALHFLAKHHRQVTRGKRGFLRGVFGRKGSSSSSRLLRGVFGDVTLRDTVKPVLIPCYDLNTCAPFVFSRADAVEIDGYDFRMREVCAATMGLAAAGRMSSVDGRTVIAAAPVDGGVATGNPAAAAITHVLNNKMEFPMAAGVDDLLLVSLGNGEAGGARLPGYATPTAAGIVRIAGDGVSDMIDQAVAMAFGQSRASSYVRIQGREANPSSNKPTSPSGDPTALLRSAEEMLLQRNVESMLFRGKKLSEKTNGEKLEWAAGELIKEQERRKKCPLPVVVFRKGSPRSSNSCSSASSSSASSSVSSP